MKKQILKYGAVLLAGMMTFSSCCMSILAGDLYYGCQGNEVIELQQMLSCLQYNVGIIDGDFGGMTEAAVISFQSENGLYVDGIVGEYTMGMLKKLLENTNQTNINEASADGNNSEQAGGNTALWNDSVLGERSLCIGTYGDDVAEMQKMLDYLGYLNSAIDGDFGSCTYTAVINFQNAYGLLTDGIAGSITLSALKNACGSGQQTGGAVKPEGNTEQGICFLTISRSLYNSITGEDVAELQNALTILGYLNDVIDGFFGNNTEAAVISFQHANGLYADGVAGPITINAINELLSGESYFDLSGEIQPYPVTAGTVLTESQLESIGIENLFGVYTISSDIFSRMRGKSYKNNCNIPLDELRYIQCLHKDINGVTKVGELVVNSSIADTVCYIFRQLYNASYPIESMILVDEFNADDETSIMSNNTSAFNFRNVDGTNELSNHAYGLAIDINPYYNVYYIPSMNYIFPENGWIYLDRDSDFPYKLEPGDLCYQLFTQAGFEWGGWWTYSPDYQHFQINM